MLSKVLRKAVNQAFGLSLSFAALELPSLLSERTKFYIPTSGILFLIINPLYMVIDVPASPGAT